MLDIAIGRTCHFCGASQTRNVRLRRREGDVEETLTAPLCPRHVVLLSSAGAGGRLHKPTGVRWWLAEEGAGAATLGPTVCPAEAFVDSPLRGHQ